jgi:hypothetical protein
VMIWVRWTLPRLRIDQVLTTCLKYCVPLAAIGFVGAVAWQVLAIPSPNDLLPATHRGKVREHWVSMPTEPKVTPVKIEPAKEHVGMAERAKGGAG